MKARRGRGRPVRAILAAVLHDFAPPLATCREAARAAQKGDPIAEDTLHRVLERLTRRAEVWARLCLDEPPVVLSTCDLRALTAATCRELSEERPGWASVRIEVADGDPVPAIIDVDLFVFALREIVANAVEATLRVARGNPEVVRVTARTGGTGSASVMIADRGRGNAAAITRAAPDAPGAKHAGEGIGLVLARAAMRAQNGSVHLQTTRLGISAILVLQGTAIRR